MVTEHLSSSSEMNQVCDEPSAAPDPHTSRRTRSRRRPAGRRPCCAEECGIERSSPRPISTAQLKELPPLHLRPINQLVLLGSYPVDPVGDLILGWASHLDAFSAYPIRT